MKNLIFSVIFFFSSISFAEKVRIFFPQLKPLKDVFYSHTQAEVKRLKYLDWYYFEVEEKEAAFYSQAGYIVDTKVKIDYFPLWEVLAAEGQTIPWGISRVKSPQAWAKNKGKGVRVCVVDTGIDPQHPDLKVTEGENFVTSNSSKWADDNGHGSHVAGIIAALDNNYGVVGVAPEAELIAIKVLNKDGIGSNSQIADGIMSCVHHKADIINLSLGGPSPSIILKCAIEKALKAGITIVAATGNDGKKYIQYPASYDGVYAVTAMGEDFKMAKFSNYGKETSFIAPGVGILSTTKKGYARFNGTSMATPHVAGVFALAQAEGKKKIETINLNLPSTQQGRGLPDAETSVK